MVEAAFGNIWDFHSQGKWIVITTNGTVKSDGSCVMGRGVAKQAKEKHPSLPFCVGDMIKRNGNHVYMFPQYKIITFPVKHNWYEKADINLIEQSTKELKEMILQLDQNVSLPSDTFFYMVRPGCGNGQLNWKDVKPILEKYLDNHFIVVEINTKQGER